MNYSNSGKRSELRVVIKPVNWRQFAFTLFLFITALFPFLVPASNDPAHGLTIVNAASSQKTLRIMMLIALMGMPCVLGYSGVIYWTFRGKVRMDETSY